MKKPQRTQRSPREKENFLDPVSAYSDAQYLTALSKRASLILKSSSWLSVSSVVNNLTNWFSFLDLIMRDDVMLVSAVVATARQKKKGNRQ